MSDNNDQSSDKRGCMQILSVAEQGLEMNKRALRLGFLLFLAALLVVYLPPTASALPDQPDSQYLIFQIFTYDVGDTAIPPHQPNKAQILATVDDITTKIGTVGRDTHFLGFAVGPICFDNTDVQVSQLINDSFEIALEKNVAVCFHIDDSMFWSTRQDLLRDSKNIEWIDWNGTPCTGRELDWSSTPLKIGPQMCFNSPAIKSAIQQRSQLIGSLIGQWLRRLHQLGKEQLFAGVIAGWETQLGQDYGTKKLTGYHALANEGFTSALSVDESDHQRVLITSNFIELWARDLAQTGIPRNRIYCHIATTSESVFRSLGGQGSYEEFVHFVTPDCAFNPFCLPGFSTYPARGVVESIYQTISRYGGSAWASCEGANVQPDGQPGDKTMEIFLAKRFNHGATLVNIFGWGLGANNMFTNAAENNDAIAAYRKFLTQRQQ
jgi:hypothetical protein